MSIYIYTEAGEPAVLGGGVGDGHQVAAHRRGAPRRHRHRRPEQLPVILL